MSGSTIVERKIINVTGKRQITIPLKYFNALGLGKEVECEFAGNAIIIRPFRNDTGFAAEILKDLVKEGYSGNELVKEFEQRQNDISNAMNIL